MNTIPHANPRERGWEQGPERGGLGGLVNRLISEYLARRKGKGEK